MASYRILRTENLPDSLKNKPKWEICVIFSAGLLIMTLSAIGAGVFIGYTYCYVAHGTGFKPDNMKQSKVIENSQPSVAESKDDAYRKTINGALSNLLIQKMLKFGHNLYDEDDLFIPRSNEEKKLEQEI